MEEVRLIEQLLMAEGGRDPGETELSEETIVDLFLELKPARSNSYNLGLELKVPESEIQKIHSSLSKPENRLLYVLLKFVTQVEPRPSWTTIISALRSPAVNLPDLAQQVAEKNCPGVLIPVVSDPGEVQDSESDSNLHQVTYAIEKGRRGYGMTLKPIRVFIGNTDNFRTHHIIERVRRRSPAWDAGLREGSLVTHINGQLVVGLDHKNVMTLIHKQDPTLYINTIPLKDTGIHDNFSSASNSEFVVNENSYEPIDGYTFLDSLPKEHSLPPARERSRKSFNRWVPKKRPTSVSPLIRSSSLDSLVEIKTSDPGFMGFAMPPDSPPTPGIRSKVLLHHSSSLSTAKKLQRTMSRSLSTPSDPELLKPVPSTSPLLRRAVSPSIDIRTSPQLHRTNSS